MKKYLMTLVLVIISGGASANANEQEGISQIKSQLMSMNGKSGSFISNFDKENNGTCTLEVTQSELGMSVVFSGTGSYLTPVAHLFDENLKMLTDDTVLVSDNSNRPGGDACGDYGGAIGYQQTLSIEGNTVKIQEKYRCTFEFFKKYTLVTSCTVK